MLVRSRVVRLDVPVMIAMSVAFFLLALDGTVSTVDGALLLGALVAYVVRSIVASRRTPHPRAALAGDEAEASPGPLWRNLLLVAVGVGLLVVGAGWLVGSATTLATSLGISDLVIGLTVVAIGTSLPELATSIIAAVRGQRDLAVGNVVGSNIFSIGSVLGLTAVVTPGGVPVEESAIVFDLPFMVAVAVALLPVVFTGLAVARWEGAVFVAYYLAYTAYLLLDAADHDALDRFSAVMTGFVVPLTVLTLGVVTIGEVRRRADRRVSSGGP
jgi:cation:H+ antiporter